MLLYISIKSRTRETKFSAEEVRAEVRRAIDAYAPGGSWLPCLPSMVPVNGHIFPIVIDECSRYGAQWMDKN